MDAALQAYDNEWKTGDRAVAKLLAAAYVEAHPEMADKYGPLDIPALVALVDAARDSGDEEERVRIDAWLHYEFHPQVIGGFVAIGTVNTEFGVENAVEMSPLEGVRKDHE